MKKLIIIVIFSTLSFHSFSQEFASGFRFGLTLSPQMSWMSAVDNGLEGNGAYLGFAYGLLMDLLIPENYAFATGILISYDGGKVTYLDSIKFNALPDIYPAGTNVNYRIQYIEIPLSMKLHTNQIGYITYFGQFGLQGGIAIRSRADIETFAPAVNVVKQDFGKDVTPGSFGLLVGGGLEYALTGNTSALIGLQFTNGFIDVTDNPSGFKRKSTLNHLRLQLGVYF